MASTQSSNPQGPESKFPAMTKPEMLAEIERVSGKTTRLRALRAELPTTKGRRVPGGAESFGVGQPRGAGGGRGAGGRGAGGGAAAPVRGALTHPQRLTMIDQAAVMLETLYAHLPLKRALHAIDPLQRLRLLRLRHEALD